MILKLNLNLVCLLFILSISATPVCIAQNSSLEFWPETDIWYRLNSSWRLSSFVSITKYNESESRDLNAFFHLDYSWGHTQFPIYRRMVDQEKEQIIKAWMVRGGVIEGRNVGINSSYYAEDMFFLEIHRRIPIKGNILLSHRFRMDNRWLGEDNNFSYRFRYRLMIEKEFKKGNSSFVPYINIEPYWDSRYSKLTKTRTIAGVTTSWSPKYALEGNVTYQYDETYDTENLYALNIILHIFLEKNQKKNSD